MFCFYQEREHSLTLGHHEDMKAAQAAHRIALDAARDAAERDRLDQIRTLKEKHNTELGEIELWCLY